MSKTSRWAAIIGVVCGAEVVAVIVIGGAGLAALVNLQTALLATLFVGALLWATRNRRRHHTHLHKR